MSSPVTVAPDCGVPGVPAAAVTRKIRRHKPLLHRLLCAGCEHESGRLFYENGTAVGMDDRRMFVTWRNANLLQLPEGLELRGQAYVKGYYAPVESRLRNTYGELLRPGRVLANSPRVVQVWIPPWLAAIDDPDAVVYLWVTPDSAALRLDPPAEAEVKASWATSADDWIVPLSGRCLAPLAGLHVYLFVDATSFRSPVLALPFTGMSSENIQGALDDLLANFDFAYVMLPAKVELSHLPETSASVVGALHRWRPAAPLP